MRLARAMVLDNVTRPLARIVASPADPRRRGARPPSRRPVIFAANHASHVDTPLLLSCLPLRFRHRTVVAAAADYFFDRRWKADAWSFLLAAIPIERTKVNRRSADLAAELLADGWNLIIFPEGGRSPDGWAQEFTGGAAYLAVAHRDARWCRSTSTAPGTSCPRAARASAGPGPPSPSAPPCGPSEGEDARRFGARIEAAVATLANEAGTDWWTARKQAAAGSHAPAPGPRRRRLAPLVGAVAGPRRDARRRRRGATGPTRTALSRSRLGRRAAEPVGARPGHRDDPAGRPTDSPATEPLVAQGQLLGVVEGVQAAPGPSEVDRAHPSSRSARAVLRARTGPCR